MWWHGKYREYWGSTIVRDSVKNCDFGGQGVTLFINPDYKVFSDGSGQDNGIGAVAILYKKNRT